MSLAAVPGARRVVEIGCGTGKASVLFARRGLGVVGVEPSPTMAAIARAHLAAFIDRTVSVAKFEEWEARPANADIVAAAQSWHWLDPDVALPKVARVLRRPGALAVFANTPGPNDTDLRSELDAVYRTCAPTLADTSVMTRWSTGPAAAERWSLIMMSYGFERPEERYYDWNGAYSTDEYVMLLRTHSDHRLLPPDDLATLIDGIARVIDNNGGKINFDYRTVLLLTRPDA